MDIKGRLLIRPSLLLFFSLPSYIHHSKPLNIFYTLSGGCVTVVNLKAAFSFSPLTSADNMRSE